MIHILYLLCSHYFEEQVVILGGKKGFWEIFLQFHEVVVNISVSQTPI